MKFRVFNWIVIAAASLAAAPALGQASVTPAPAASASEAPPAADQPEFKQEEIEQMVASIALYPDSLLTQVLMASTYPIEVVEAERWLKKNTSLKGDALAKELEKQTWDASVKSLINFPQVLEMMSDNLSTTVKIGDAFLGQQKEVMAAIQTLRAKAQATGNLKTTEQQNVTTEKTDTGSQVIVIQSASPEVIYVPQYSPTVVYGTWPYPAYAPYPYYPAGYVATAALSFGLGVACGAAWGYAWGNCNWGRGDVNINVNQNANFNKNIDRSGNRGQQGQWKHDSSHRQGAAYRNQATAQKVGAGQASNRATQGRNDYRGKAEQGRSDIARGGADSVRNNSQPNRGSGSGPSSDRSLDRRSSGGQSGAFGDANRGGASAKQSSNRGSSSRASSPSQSRPSNTGGGSRGGGGGSRGGGGGGRGGGGRR